MISVRPAGGGDVSKVDALLRKCFPLPDEAELVRNLCIDGDMVLILVATDDADELLGLVAFSRMSVSVAGKPVSAVALAPVAVARAHRGSGVADALIRAGLAQLESAGIVLCFVLGDNDFYGRFGFDASLARNYVSPYAGDNLMAIALQGGLVPCGVREHATHAPAFAKLGAEQ